MTYTGKELQALGVSEDVLVWRAWRRSMHLSQLEAAVIAGVGERTLFRTERGLTKPQQRTLAKLQALMQRWKGHHPKPSDDRGAHDKSV